MTLRARVLPWLRFGWAVPLAIAGVVAALPSLAVIGPLLQRELLLAAIYALLVAGFNLGFGYGGQLALGQVAVFAGGAYSTAILFNHKVTDLGIATLVAIAVAAVLGLITGLPGLRFTDWALALVAFFLVLLIPHLTALFPTQTGGTIGLPGILGPRLFGQTLSSTGFYAVGIVVTAVCLLLYRNLVLSRFGHSLFVLKQGPALARALGLSPYRLRLSAYLLAGLPAGLAGVLFAYYSTFVQQDFFSFNLVTLLLAASVVGGATSIWGAPVAATILVIGPDRASSFNKYSVLAYGVFLMLAGLGLSGGLAAIGRRFLGYVVGRAPETLETDAPAAEAEPVTRARLAIAGEELRTTAVAKRFGGVEALRGVDFEAKPGAITAIIGANGAGKTTLLNTISGLIPPDTGEITLGDTTITHLAPDRIARAGVSRTFQTPQVPEALTVLDVAASGRIAERWVPSAAIMARLPRYNKVHREDVARAHSALEFVGLDREAHMLANALPLGRRRILEVARSISGGPSVVLLDEPAAGLDGDALDNLRSVLVRMRDAGATVVLIEHNVTFVLDVADTVYVMDLGAVIAKGRPDDVRNDEKVIASYLGRRGTTHTTLDDALPVEAHDAG